jgi:transcriptional regulator with XRE-family HTH domain
MTQEPASPNRRDQPPAIGDRLRALRKARRMSLDELSRAAEVSKSMLSQIERNLTNPTVAVVWRLSRALGVELASFLASDTGGAGEEPAIEVIEADGIPRLHSRSARYELRILGPIRLAGNFEWYHLSIEPGGKLASEPHEAGAMEHLSVFKGTLAVTAGSDSRRLKTGETARYPVDVAHAIANPGDRPAEALLVVEYAVPRRR